MEKIKRRYLLVLMALVMVLIAGCTMQKSEKKADNISKILTNEAFNNVLLNTSDSDVVIQTGKNYQVKYHGSKKIEPSVEIKNGQLFVKQRGNVSSRNNLSEIVITIPKAVKLTQLEIKADEGDITATGINRNLGQLKSEEGDITLWDAKMTSGELSSEEGDITLKKSKIDKNLHASSSEGDVAVSRTKFIGYNLSTEEGSIAVDGNSYASSSYKKHPDSKNILTVKSQEGDITVK